jgi:hypothetical protein
VVVDADVVVDVNGDGDGDVSGKAWSTCAPMNGVGPVRRRERLGGVFNFYYRDAA